MGKTQTQLRRLVIKPAATSGETAPPPMRLFLVRCTFVGEVKKKQLDGSFRFLIEAPDAASVHPRLAAAVRKLRRTGELPARCDVYVEFMLEPSRLRHGVVTDFERWEREPRRFQHGCITFSETCVVHGGAAPEPAFRFGAPPARCDTGGPAGCVIRRRIGSRRLAGWAKEQGTGRPAA